MSKLMFRITVLILSAALTGILVSNDYPVSSKAMAYEKCECDNTYKNFQDMGNRKGNRKQSKLINKQALGKHKKKQYCEALQTWCKAAEKDPSWWKPFFNMACAAALMGDPDKAFDYIELALVRDKKRVLHSFKRDGDLKSLRKLSGYEEIISRYEGISYEEAVSIYRKAVSRGNARLLKSIIHRDRGLKIVNEGNTQVYTREDIDPGIVRTLPDEIGKAEKNGVCGNSNNSAKYHYMQSDYTQDPPEATPRCEGWTDNCIEFRKMGGSWYLIETSKNGNGGC